MVTRSYAPTPGKSTVPCSHLAVLAWFAFFACAGPARTPSPATIALIEQAEAAEAKRRYDRASQLYERAKSEAPDARSRALAARTYARSLIFWGEHGRAEAELEEAARLAPEDAGSWHDLGMLRHERGDLAAAEAAFRRSIAARPRDVRSRIALAAMLVEQRRYRHALNEYEALAKIDLPSRLRDKVAWAIQTLRRRLAQPEQR